VTAVQQRVGLGKVIRKLQDLVTVRQAEVAMRDYDRMPLSIHWPGVDRDVEGPPAAVERLKRPLMPPSGANAGGTELCSGVPDKLLQTILARMLHSNEHCLVIRSEDRAAVGLRCTILFTALANSDRFDMPTDASSVRAVSAAGTEG
jgi:hypothetical protein